MAAITLAIIGLQRMGTSFGLAVKRYMKTPNVEHQFTIIGSDESVDAVRAAHKSEAIDQEARTPAAAVAKADLVILATRYGLYDDLYQAISSSLKAGVVILDLSPLKQRAIARADKYLPRDSDGHPLAYMVGATPIINPLLLNDPGDTTESARADLFDKGTMILSPSVSARGEAIQLAADFSELLGMSVHFTEPAEHDGMVASIEGLPLLTALAVFRTLRKNNTWDDLRRLGNPPFAISTLGLEQITAQDALALFDGNRDRAAQALEALINTLDEVRDVLMADDPLLLGEAFEDAINQRAEWQHLRRQNTWDTRTAIKPTEDISIGGVMSGRFLGRFLRPGADKGSDKNGGKKS